METLYCDSYGNMKIVNINIYVDFYRNWQCVQKGISKENQKGGLERERQTLSRKKVQ